VLYLGGAIGIRRIRTKHPPRTEMLNASIAEKKSGRRSYIAVGTQYNIDLEEISLNVPKSRVVALECEQNFRKSESQLK